MDGNFILDFVDTEEKHTMALTKAQIVESIRYQTGFTKDRSFQIVETLLEIIKSTLESREDVMISGFGRFCVREKRERKGRNPATGDDLMLSSRRVVTFRCSGKLRDRVNSH
jgi:integration host factor subunit alpha